MKLFKLKLTCSNYEYSCLIKSQVIDVTYGLFSDGAGLLKLSNNPESLNSDITFTLHIPSEFPCCYIYDICAQFNQWRLERGYIDSVMRLETPYLPYARADRGFSLREGCGLKAFMNTIKMMGFSSIKSCDTHSEKHWMTIHENTPPQGKNCDVICYPDKGAHDRYACTDLFNSKDFVICEKQRDEKGWITKYAIIRQSFENFSGRKITIVDDICDGGMTFILCAKELRAKGASSIKLKVTHGIFAKGLEIFKGVIDEIEADNIVGQHITKEDLENFNGEKND